MASMKFNDRRPGRTEKVPAGRLRKGDTIHFGGQSVVVSHAADFQHRDGSGMTTVHGPNGPVGAWQRDSMVERTVRSSNRLSAAEKRDVDHNPRLDDDSDLDEARCKGCGERIVWIGPNHSDWKHAPHRG